MCERCEGGRGADQLFVCDSMHESLCMGGMDILCCLCALNKLGVCGEFVDFGCKTSVVMCTSMSTFGSKMCGRAVCTDVLMLELFV